MSVLTKIHHKLLPEDPDIGYMPYVWLCYLVMFFLSFFFQTLNSQQITLSTIGVVLFLVMYFRAFWVTTRQLYFYIFGIALIGFILATQNLHGAGVFYVYAAAFCVQFNKPQTSFMVLGALIALYIITGLLFGVHIYIYLTGSFFGLIVGAGNIIMNEMSQKNTLIKASQEEIKKIATSAERERIARDLHDLIGHTFSAINIKAQLATKLVNHDTEKAIQEIKEIEKISRNSLAEVREAVSGYRKRDLATEISQAKVLLDSLDIQVTTDITPVDELNLSTTQNTALAFIVRELTTNIMRHAQATECELTLQSDNHNVTLSVADNGNTKNFKAGSGLKGIRERSEQLKGHADFKINHGFVACIRIPVP